MSHPGWVMVSFLTELLSSYGGFGKLPHSGQDSYCANDTEVIDNLLKESYNKHYIPAYPVRVRVDMWVQEVTAVSELTQDFEIDLYINEFWEDPALVFDYMNPCKNNISFDDKVLQRLWIPNTCFINSKTASIHESPFRNVFLMIFSNSTIWTNYRMKLTGPCDMNLKRFPFDQQKCFLTFESFNYNTGEVRMEWNQPFPVMLLKPIELPDFVLVNFSVIAIEQMYPAGWWDELTVAFVFKRRYGWYLVQVYSVGYVTIFISWISFYLGSRAIPARTMLGVNSLLAMTFQFGNIIRNLPRVSYVKAIDVWMLSGMMFIFFSLLELAVVGFMTRNEGLPRARFKKRSTTMMASYGGGEIEEFSWKEMASPRIGLRQFWVDKQYTKSMNNTNGDDVLSMNFESANNATRTFASTPLTTAVVGLHQPPMGRGGYNRSGESGSPPSPPLSATPSTTMASYKKTSTTQSHYSLARFPTTTSIEGAGGVTTTMTTTTTGAANMSDQNNNNNNSSRADPGSGTAVLIQHRRRKRTRPVDYFSWFGACLHALKRVRPETVDKYSAILFPATYFIFNLGYWIYYLSDLSSGDEVRII